MSAAPHRTKLPRRRQNVASGPPADLLRRGWGLLTPSTPSPRSDSPLRRSASKTRMGRFRHDPGAELRAQWFLPEAVEALRSRGHKGQLQLAELFQTCSKSPGESELMQILRELNIPCLAAQEIQQFVHYCLGPLPISREVALQRLRGGTNDDRELAVEAAFVRVSLGRRVMDMHTLSCGYEAAAHPSTHGPRGRARADVLGDFFELLRAEGLQAGDNLSLATFQRVCEGLGTFSPEDAAFAHLLAHCFPGEPELGSLGKSMRRIQTGLAQLHAAQLDDIFTQFDHASELAAPDLLAHPPPPEPFKYGGNQIIANVPASSNPAFAGYHKTFFRGQPFLCKDLRQEEPTKLVKPARAMNMSEFVQWLLRWKLNGVSRGDAENLFVFADADRSGGLDFDELEEVLQMLSGALSEERKRQVDYALQRCTGTEEGEDDLNMQDALRVRAEFVGLTNHDEGFAQWLRKKVNTAAEIEPEKIDHCGLNRRGGQNLQSGAYPRPRQQMPAGLSPAERELFQRSDGPSAAVAPFRRSLFGA